jgi:hypothetical protein
MYRRILTCFRWSLLLFVVLGASSPVALAQRKAKLQYMDQVILLDGTSREGHIQEYVPDRYVLIRDHRDRENTFSMDEVARIEYGTVEGLIFRRQRERRPYAFVEEGWYHQTGFGVSLGREAVESDFNFGPGVRTVFGFHLQYVMGWQFSRYFGLGGGLSFDVYNFERREMALAPLLQLRSFLTRTNTAPYVSFGAGYGFAFKNRDFGLNRAQGGVLLHPAVGVRFTGSNGTAMSIDFGYRLQRAEYETFTPAEGLTIRNTRYQRAVIRTEMRF